MLFPEISTAYYFYGYLSLNQSTHKNSEETHKGEITFVASQSSKHLSIATICSWYQAQMVYFSTSFLNVGYPNRKISKKH